MVDVGADHLVGSGGGGSFIAQAMNNFTFEIEKLDGIGLSINGISGLTFTCTIGEIPYQNVKIKYIQAAEFDDVTMEIRDFIDQDIAGKLYTWFAQGYNPENDQIGTPADYKADGTLIEHDPKGGNERKWTLRGCFISSFSPGDFSMESQGEQVMINATLSVDKVLRG